MDRMARKSNGSEIQNSRLVFAYFAKMDTSPSPVEKRENPCDIHSSFIRL